MIEHDGCEMCKYFNCNELDINSPCYDCVSAHKRRMLEDKFEPMTNGDKIRKMNDEELAEFLTRITDDAQLDSKIHCNYMWKEWLKKEVYNNDWR